MMSILLTIAFFGSLGITGFSLSTFFLRARSTVAIAAGTVLLGVALYIFTVNILGYLLPIRQVFWLAHGVLLLLSAVLWGVQWLQSDRWQALHGLQWPPRAVSLLLAGVILFAGAAFARDRGSDEWTWIHFALPATIVEGNFPVKDPTNPWDDMSYHYGPALFIASLSSVTGISLASAHASVPILSVAGIVLFAAALGWELSRSWKAASLCAVLALGASGFFWLRGDQFVADLIQHYVLHLPIIPASETPFRGFTPMIRDLLSGSLLMLLGHRAIAPGAAFFWGFLFVFYEALSQSSWRRCVPWVLMGFVLSAELALTIETTLLMLWVSAAAYGVFLVISAISDRSKWKTCGVFTAVSASIFVPSLLAAFWLGGTLTHPDVSLGSSAFAWNLTGRMVINRTVEGIVTVAPWEWTFFRDFAPLLLSLGIATVYAWKQRRTSPFLLFLCVLAAAHVLPTWVLTYMPFPANLFRLHFIGNSIVGFLFGITCWEMVFSKSSRASRRQKLLAIAWITALLLSSGLHAATRLIFPDLRLHASALLPAMPPITSAESELYTWVRTHSSQSDWFYIYEEELPQKDISQQMLRDRLLLSMYTGRFVVGIGSIVPPKADKMQLLDAVKNTCSLSAFNALGIRYLVLTHEVQARWFRDHCIAADWRILYGDKTSLPVVLTKEGD